MRVGVFITHAGGFSYRKIDQRNLAEGEVEHVRSRKRREARSYPLLEGDARAATDSRELNPENGTFSDT